MHPKLFSWRAMAAAASTSAADEKPALGWGDKVGVRGVCGLGPLSRARVRRMLILPARFVLFVGAARA